MNTTNVPPEEPTGYQATVAELRRLADAFDTLGEPPPGEEAPYLSFGFVLNTVAAVDAVSLAVLGKAATTQQRGDSWFRIADGGPRFGRGFYHVQASVPPPPDERDAELAVLRAEVQKLRATAAPTRDADRDELRVPAEDMTLVPPTDPDDLPAPTGVTHYFTLGEIDEQGRGYYVAVTAPTAERCRSLMVETYGSGWCDEYADLPGDYEWVQTNRLVEWQL